MNRGRKKVTKNPNQRSLKRKRLKKSSLKRPNSLKNRSCQTAWSILMICSLVHQRVLNKLSNHKLWQVSISKIWFLLQPCLLLHHKHSNKLKSRKLSPKQIQILALGMSLTKLKKKLRKGLIGRRPLLTTIKMRTPQNIHQSNMQVYLWVILLLKHRLDRKVKVGWKWAQNSSSKTKRSFCILKWPIRPDSRSCKTLISKLTKTLSL